MKKEYNTPEWELQLFSFESILNEKVLDVSKNESGGSDYNDDNQGEW